MPNDISLPSPSINPGVSQGGGFAPNPIDSFLDAFMGARKQKSSESAAARDHEIQLAYLDIAKQKAKTESDQLKLQQSREDAQGGAVQAFLKMLQPLGEASAQKAMASGQDPLGSLFGAQQGQGSPIAMGGPQGPAQTPMAPPAPVSAPSTASPVPNWAQITAGMSPSATAAFVEQDLPHLLALQKGLNPQDQGQQVQTGDMVTTFVPGKGFWDPKANQGKGGFVPTIERGMSKDEKTIKMLQIRESEERILAMRDYRTAMMAQSQTRQFNSRTKDLQQRGAIINQALQTISDAQNNPDPQQRKILYSSAIANFVQAADQKAQLRYQMLQYFKNNIDPSVAGKWNVLRTRMLQGSLPAYATQGMLHHLTNLLSLTGSEYDKQRSAEVKRHPELGNWLPEKQEFFDPMTVNQQQSPDLAPPP